MPILIVLWMFVVSWGYGQSYRSLEEVRDLGYTEAVKAYPVEVKGKVVFSHDEWWLMGIANGTNGVLVFREDISTRYEAGQVLSIKGETTVGDKVSMIEAEEISVLDEDLEAKPNPVALSDVSSGKVDSKWVTVGGTVARCEYNERQWRLLLIDDETMIDVVIIGTEGRERFPMEGNEVRLNGLVATYFEKGSAHAVRYLFVQNHERIQIEPPRTDQPKSVGEVSLQEFYRDEIQSGLTDRFKISGTLVASHWEGWHVVAVKESTVRVETSTLTNRLEVGNVYDFEGYRFVSDGRARLQAIHWEKKGNAEEYGIAEPSWTDLVAGLYDGRVVRLEAEFVRSLEVLDDFHWWLRGEDETALKAVISKHQWNMGAMPVSGSRLMLEGVLESGQMTPVLHLRFDSDVELLSGPEPERQLDSSGDGQSAVNPWLMGIVGCVLGIIGISAIRRPRRSSGSDALNAKDWMERMGGVFLYLDRHAEVVCVSAGMNDLLNEGDLKSVETFVEEKTFQWLKGAMIQAEETNELRRFTGRVTFDEFSTGAEFCVGSTGFGWLLEIRIRQVQEGIQEEIVHSQRLDAVGQLAAGVAHDFNNILTIIKGHAEVLLHHDPEMEQRRESSQIIETAADRGAKLTQQLLTFSRRKAFRMESINLNDCIDDITKILRRTLGEHVDLDFKSRPGLPNVVGDSGMLSQVFINLAINARDAMPDGGTLEIETRNLVIDAGEKRPHPDAREGRFVSVEVRDNGEGISAEIVPRIFEPFFTTKEVGKGTGLGLAMVYGIIKEHEGWVEVDSGVGQGTRFTILLPATDSLKDRTEEVPEPPSRSSSNERILVVEDSPELRRLVDSALKRFGYEIVQAENGVEATAIWYREKGEFDLLLTDMVMPGGVTGAALAERLLEDKPDLKVGFMTGYSAEAQESKGWIVEGENLIQKPFTPRTLAQFVQKLLNQEV